MHVYIFAFLHNFKFEYIHEIHIKVVQKNLLFVRPIQIVLRTIHIVLRTIHIVVRTIQIVFWTVLNCGGQKLSTDNCPLSVVRPADKTPIHKEKLILILFFIKFSFIIHFFSYILNVTL
jgi:hypothetical protein